MRADKHRLLHWLLVIALAVLPLRATFAAPPCDIHDSGKHGGMHHPEAPAMTDHSAHVAGMMQHHEAAPDKDTQRHDCCCCDDGARCSSDCDMGLHAPAIMQSAPVLASNHLPMPLTGTSDSLYSLILTPPSRPPLALHI